MCPLCGCETSSYPRQVHASPSYQAPSTPPGLAARNHAWLTEQGIVALSLLGTPGAGMTTLLDSTVERLQDRLDVRVVQADAISALRTMRSQPQRDAGLQNEGDNQSLAHAGIVCDTLTHTASSSCSLLLIENTRIDGSAPGLGEQAKIVVASLLEGDDNPLKHSHVVRSAQALVLTKLDLLGLVDFNVDAYLQRALSINPRLQIFGLSARSGAGMDEWCNWLLRAARAPVRKARPDHHEESRTLRRSARRNTGRFPDDLTPASR